MQRYHYSGFLDSKSRGRSAIILFGRSPRLHTLGLDSGDYAALRPRLFEQNQLYFYTPMFGCVKIVAVHGLWSSWSVRCKLERGVWSVLIGYFVV